MERNDFSNFVRGSPEKHFCEIILKSGHWPRRQYRLKKLLTDGRTVGQISITMTHLERSGELKMCAAPHLSPTITKYQLT